MELNDFKRQIHEYVESRMTFIAPNLSIIVGASTAAKLMGKPFKGKLYPNWISVEVKNLFYSRKFCVL